MTAHRRGLLFAGVIVVFVVLLDQITKWLVWNRFGPAGDRFESEYLGGLLHFHFVRNTGSAFGLFQGQSGLLTIATFLAIGLLAAFFVRSAREDPIVAIALGLLLGGAIGNLIDRIRLGYVIDFIKLPNWPTFNVADSAITVGVIMLFVAVLFRDLLEDRRVEAVDGVPDPGVGLHSARED